jgi:cyclic pyranopterin phosphate synthase
MTANGAIDYLRVSVTDRCNFRCSYCMPPEGVAFKGHDEILSFEEIECFVRVAADAGITRVRLTGGEPLVRRGCADLVSRLTSIPGVRDLSLTTNGSLLAAHAGELLEAGLERINISVNSLDAARFARISGSDSLAGVRDGLDAAVGAGFRLVKVNAVMLEGIEDELEAFLRLADELPVHLRFIECMPVGREGADQRHFVPRERLLVRLREFGELKPVPSPGGAGPARYYRLGSGKGTIGFISAMSDHICVSCNRIRLTADGKLRNCLFSDEEVDIRGLINGDSARLREAIRASMNSKKYDRRQVTTGNRTMSQIGG